MTVSSEMKIDFAEIDSEEDEDDPTNGSAELIREITDSDMEGEQTYSEYKNESQS